MRSKASIKSHPIHPILVSFPIAFLTATFVCDLIAFITGNEVLWQAGFYLGITGIVMGLVAAVPGIIDYIYTVPPDSSAKKRGAKHGLLNTLQILLFFTAWMIRDHVDTRAIFVILLEGAGFIMMGIAGWLGGTLVYRNQIGVDPRYAEAGKWKEEYIDPTGEKIKVARSGELKVNQMKLLHIGHKRIVIGNTENGYVAFDDRCTHRGGSLAAGALMCSTVQCPWHGSQFNVDTGNVTAGPAEEDIDVYSLTESNGDYYLQL